MIDAYCRQDYDFAVTLAPGFVDELRASLGDPFVITEPEQLATYDCDGLTGWRAQPSAVVLPGSAVRRSFRNE